jgi:PPM family protein phosphatase
VPDAAEALKQVPLFASLNQRQLKRLARKFKPHHFKAGTVVVQEGKMSGIGFFVITDGEASVSTGGKEAARLGPGAHFGEPGLILERERTASVTAETNLTCLEIPTWDFREFVQSDGDVSWKLLQHVVATLLAAEPPVATAAPA